MEYTAQDVKNLRAETGATFADCKQVLTESSNWDDARKNLSAKNARKAEKMSQSDRETSQGSIFSYIHHNQDVGVIGTLLELSCSTDFVARSAVFQQLGHDIALHIAGMAPVYTSVEEMPADHYKEIEQRIASDPSMQKVPEEKRAMVLERKMQDALAPEVLLLQYFVKDSDKTIGDMIRKAIAETGENIVVRRFSRFTVGR